MPGLRDYLSYDTPATGLAVDQAFAEGGTTFGNAFTAGRFANEANYLAAEEASLRAAGNAAAADANRQQIQGLQRRAAVYQPEVSRVEGVGMSNFGTYAGSMLGQAAASTIDPIAAAGAARAAGFIPHPLAQAIGRVGTLAAPFMVGQRQQTGENYNAMVEDPVLMARTTDVERRDAANLTGAGQAVLDSMLPAAIARRTMGAGLRAGVSRMPTGVRWAGDAIGEGLTETAQQIGQQQMLGQLNPNRDTSGDRSELLNSFVGGAVGGAGLSAPSLAADSGFRRVGQTIERGKEIGNEALRLGKDGFERMSDSEPVKKAGGMLGRGKEMVSSLFQRGKEIDLKEVGGEISDYLKEAPKKYARDRETMRMLRGEFDASGLTPDGQAAFEKGQFDNPEVLDFITKQGAEQEKVIDRELERMAPEVPQAAQLRERLAAAQGNDRIAQYTDAAKWIVEQASTSQLQAAATDAAERFGSMARTGGELAGKGARGALKVATDVGKAAVKGFSGKRNEQEAGDEQSWTYDQWLQEQGRRRTATDAFFEAGKATPEMTQAADVASSYLESEASKARPDVRNMRALASDMSFTMLNEAQRAARFGLGKQNQRLNRVVNRMRLAFGDNAESVLGEAKQILLKGDTNGQIKPGIETVLSYMTSELKGKTRETPEMRDDDTAKAMVAALPIEAEKSLSDQGINVRDQDGRRALFDVITRYAENGDARMRPELEKAVGGRDTLNKLLDLIDEGDRPEEVVAELPNFEDSKEEGIKADSFEERLAQKRLDQGESPDQYVYRRNVRRTAGSRRRPVYDPELQFFNQTDMVKDADGKDTSQSILDYALDKEKKRLGDDEFEVTAVPAEQFMRDENLAIPEGGLEGQFVIRARRVAPRDEGRMDVAEFDRLVEGGRAADRIVGEAAYRETDGRDEYMAAVAKGLDARNVLYFQDAEKPTSRIPVLAGELAKWGMERLDKTLPDGAQGTRDEKFIAGLTEGIGAVIASGRVGKSLPYRVNAEGKKESFSRGLPPSLRVGNKTVAQLAAERKADIANRPLAPSKQNQAPATTAFDENNYSTDNMEDQIDPEASTNAAFEDVAQRTQSQQNLRAPTAPAQSSPIANTGPVKRGYNAAERRAAAAPAKLAGMSDAVRARVDAIAADERYESLTTVAKVSAFLKAAGDRLDELRAQDLASLSDEEALVKSRLENLLNNEFSDLGMFFSETEDFGKLPDKEQKALLASAEQFRKPAPEVAGGKMGKPQSAPAGRAKRNEQEAAPRRGLYIYQADNGLFELHDDSTGEFLDIGHPLSDENTSQFQTREDAEQALRDWNDGKYSAQGTNKSTHIASAEDMARARLYIYKVLGPKVKVSFEKITGYSGEWIEATNAIKISTFTKAGVLNVAYHEALHALWSRLGQHQEVRDLLTNVTSNPAMLQRLKGLLAGHPKAIAQLGDAEERVAYAYQFWAAGLLDVGFKADTWFKRLRRFFRTVFGMVRDDERAMEIFEAFHKGGLAEPSAAGQAINEIMQRGTNFAKVRRKLDKQIQAVYRYAAPAVTVLASSESATARDLATQFWTNPGDEDAGGKGEGQLNAQRRVTGQYLNSAKEVLKGLTDKDLVEVARYLQRETELAAIPYAPHRDAVKRVRGLLRTFYTYSKEAGVALGDIGEKYYPRTWDTQKLIDSKDAFVQMLETKYADVMDMVLTANQNQQALGAKDRIRGDHEKHDPILRTPKDVAEYMWARIVDRGGIEDHLNAERTGAHIIDRIDAKREDGALTPFFQSSNTRDFKWLKKEDAEPFLDKDIVGQLTRYFRQGVRSAEYTRRFGHGSGKDNAIARALGYWRNEKVGEDQYEPVEWIKGTIEQELEAAAPKGDKEWISRRMKDIGQAVGAMEGTLGKDISPGWRKAASWAMVYQNIRLLPLALFSSIVDPLGLVARGGSMSEAYDGFLRGMRDVYRSYADMFSDGPVTRKNDAMEQLAEDIGTVDSQHFLDSMGQAYASEFLDETARKWNNKLFTLNGMEAWNRAMRVQATTSAVRFIESIAGRTDADSVRWLKELGFEPGKVPLKNGKLIVDKHDLGIADPAQASAEIAKVHAAVNRWVEGAVLTPNSAQRPAWASDPHWSFVFHLKQFTYSFHQTIMRRAVNELGHGNLGPMAAFIWYVPVMIAADVTKGLIQGGGELPAYMKSYNLGDWMMHGIQRAGLLGVGQMGLDIAEDPASILGPSVEQVSDAVREPLAKTVVRALPANSIYREALQ